MYHLKIKCVLLITYLYFDIFVCNFQSLLGSPDKSYKDIRPDTSEFTSKRIDDPFDMDVVSSTPKARKTAESPQMKITPPQVIVQNPEDEDENLVRMRFVSKIMN